MTQIANYVTSTFKAIDEEFEKFTAQIPWLLWIYCDFKTNAIEDCLTRLSSAPENFKVRSDLCEVHG